MTKIERRQRDMVIVEVLHIETKRAQDEFDSASEAWEQLSGALKDTAMGEAMQILTQQRYVIYELWRDRLSVHAMLSVEKGGDK